MKHVVILIALLLIVLSALTYITGPVSKLIPEPGNTHTAGAESKAAGVPASPQSSAGDIIPQSSAGDIIPRSSGDEAVGVDSGSPEKDYSNTIPDSELEEKAESGWELKWNDEFNGSVINDKYWTLQTGEDIWGNNELQYYTDRAENCYVEDGKLVIRGLQEKYGNSNYTSARVVTKDKFGFLYGKIEVRAKLPKGKGLLSAIWLLPCEYIYSDRHKNGEFDLVEMLGNDPKKIFGVVHYSFNGKKKSYKKYGAIDYSKDFHVYSIEWDSKRIKWLVDGKAYFTFSYNKAFDKNYDPFNKPFYLIINLAVGGDWPGDNISKTAFPSLLEIDYVRYYCPKKP